MSGVMDFVFPKPVLQGPIEKKLALEDNRRIVRSIGAGQVAGAWFIAWALTLSFVTPPLPVDETEADTPPVVTVKLPEDGYHSKTRRKPKESLQPHENKGPKPASRNPSKEEGKIKLELITSKKEHWATEAYKIIKNASRGVDQEKIENTARLTRTEETRIAGRPGAKRDAWDDAYIPDGDGKGGNPLDMLETSRPKGIENDRTGLERPVGNSAISMGTEERFRSSDEILAVVRSHAPGLRHLYNTHLKMNPGMSGKVTIRFAISPSGRVVDAAIASGTTGSRRFEQEVLQKILSWRFEIIKAHGNDIVTVPFNFSE